MKRSSSRRCAGFTLVELVVGLVISTIVIGFAASLMTTPVDAYFAQTRRSDLVDRSDSITRNLQRDLGMAVPNSVRIRNVGNRTIVEMLVADVVTFYRPFQPVAEIGAAGSLSASDRGLDFTAADGRLSVFGPIRPLVTLPTYNYFDRFLVVNNAGELPNDAYRLQRVITPTPVTLTIVRDPASYATTREEQLTFTPAFQFRHPPSATSSRRMFLVSGPVAYICNSGAGTLRRYDNYAITAATPANENAAQLNVLGVRNTVLATEVSACSFTCPGTTNAAPRCLKALNVDVGLSRSNGTSNDTTRIYAQLPVDNTP